MIIAVNTDCVKLDPVPALDRIAAAGFRHLIWCWHWNDNYLYTPEDITFIRRILKERIEKSSDRWYIYRRFFFIVNV